MSTISYQAILEAIKFLYGQGVDVEPYLDRLQGIIGYQVTMTDVFSHKHTDPGIKVSVGMIRSYGHKVEIKSRDNREPRLVAKLKLERWIQDIFVRRLKDQFYALQNEYKAVKPNDLPKVKHEKKYIDELITAILTGASEGIELISIQTKLGFDLTKANAAAAQWAREYSYDLIKGIDQTTLEIVRDVITRFVENDKYTMGDVFYALTHDAGYTDIRAAMIGVTETTRAFAQGQKEAALEIQKEFPEVQMVKTWFTNNDDIVCDECGPLDGQEIQMEDEFEGGIDAPPKHVNCRCWIQYNTRVGDGG